MGRVIRFRRTEVERVVVPCAWGIAILDQTISYLNPISELARAARESESTRGLRIVPLLPHRRR